MLKITENIKSWYAINLLEGEGLGTAYEYYVKLKKLERFINVIGRPKNILIAGLPEKYGLSMDFFLLGQMVGADTVATDERADVLERAKKVLSIIKSRNHFSGSKVVFIKTDQIEHFNGQIVTRQSFDLVLSSEVFQRLNGARGTYMSNLTRVAKNFAIFAPNRENEAHAYQSGLRSVHLKELLRSCHEGHSGVSTYAYGYIDMPPFPPGLRRSQQKREYALTNRLESFLMKGLENYSRFEELIPNPIKQKFAHIVYVIGRTQRSQMHFLI